MSETPNTTEPRHQRPERQELSWHADPTGRAITFDNGVGLMNCLIAERPDWKPNEIMAVLDRFRDKKPRVLRRAAFALAELPNATPEDLDTQGPWWDDKPRAAASAVEAPKPLRPPPSNDTSPMCPRHPTLHTWECNAESCKPKKHTRPKDFDAIRAQAAEEARIQREADEARLAEALAADQKRLAKLGVAPWRAGE